MAASIHECAMLLPSPTQATRMPSTVAQALLHRLQVGQDLHGWCRSLRPLMTGTLLCCARCSTRSWPNVRNTTACRKRENMRAESSMVSPRPSWMSAGLSVMGSPPSS